MPDRRRSSAGLRVADGAAGLLSGGLLLVGVALLVMQLLAPSALGGTGLARATGPGWGSVAAHLAVGLGGEALVLCRNRLPDVARACADVAVLLAVAATLWFAWWR